VRHLAKTRLRVPAAGNFGLLRGGRRSCRGGNGHVNSRPSSPLLKRFRRRLHLFERGDSSRRLVPESRLAPTTPKKLSKQNLRAGSVVGFLILFPAPIPFIVLVFLCFRRRKSGELMSRSGYSGTKKHVPWRHLSFSLGSLCFKCPIRIMAAAFFCEWRLRGFAPGGRRWRKTGQNGGPCFCRRRRSAFAGARVYV